MNELHARVNPPSPRREKVERGKQASEQNDAAPVVAAPRKWPPGAVWRRGRRPPGHLLLAGAQEELERPAERVQHLRVLWRSVQSRVLAGWVSFA